MTEGWTKNPASSKAEEKHNEDHSFQRSWSIFHHRKCSVFVRNLLFTRPGLWFVFKILQTKKTQRGLSSEKSQQWANTEMYSIYKLKLENKY